MLLVEAFFLGNASLDTVSTQPYGGFINLQSVCSMPSNCLHHIPFLARDALVWAASVHFAQLHCPLDVLLPVGWANLLDTGIFTGVIDSLTSAGLSVLRMLTSI